MFFRYFPEIPRYARYAVTLSLVAFSLLVNAQLNPHLKSSIYFLPLTAVALSAIWFGVVPGLFATCCSLLGIKLGIFETSFHVVQVDELRFFLFLPAGLLVSLLGGNLRNSWELAIQAKIGVENALRLLQEEKRMREIFINGLSHDLRNPISVARLVNESLLRNSVLSISQRRSLERAILSLDRADGLIQNVLDADRIRAGNKISLHLSEFDLLDIAKSVIKEINLLYGAEVKLFCETSVIFGIWDQHAIYRCLENLLSNAAKYGTSTQPVTLRISEKSSKGLEICVHNFGPAIPVQDQATLFDPYSRTESAERSGQIGWGLGLASTKILVDAHGGRIRVNSSLEEGTNFIIWLPVNTSLNLGMENSIA